ncbi:hypothetical protein PIB30_058849 [Stylosanthes scabra]|uniref:Retrotransposon gag domain-containing protein n=1 Tax=Stylosanthes scabra TaxID=79078 RepID=A0ABU6YIX5_9FABA|nr:hypothetical protein [Stylosanthes scabra]
MANQGQEGSGDEQRRDQQLKCQQEELDLNATANDGTGVCDGNVDSGGVQNGQPHPHPTNPSGRRTPSAIDKLESGGTSHNWEQCQAPSPRPFKGIGSNEFNDTQELRHRMQSMELEITLPISISHSPRRRPQSCTPPRRRRHHSSSDGRESSSEEDQGRNRSTFRRYKKTRDQEETPPIDGHTPFSSRILKVQPPRDFIKLTDMKYDRSTDPHVHLSDFEHRMVCDGAVDKIKSGSISSFSEIKELFLNEFTTSIDNTKHPINLLAVLQKPNETTRKYIERFDAECKTIDKLVDAMASLCLMKGLANDDFRKQLMTKPVWSRKEMQVIAKEFIHHEEVNRVVAATKNHYKKCARYQRIYGGFWGGRIAAAEVAAGAAGGWGSYEIVLFRRCRHLSRHYGW